MKLPNSTNNFDWKPFSRKQMQTLTWWCPDAPYHNYDGIIADGAVRSGKTVSMGISFVLWAMSSFSGQQFAICGKTIGSLRKNVVNTLKSQAKSLGFSVTDKRAENLILIGSGDRVNYFYLYGGKDERSQDLIQGITLAGIYFDEVALMPESFVAQGEARCSVSGAKMWYNCNPEGPKHWFKLSRIDQRELKRFLYLHFTMEDNLTLSPEVLERYKRQWKGVFYERNVLGLWVAAEGRIYTCFGQNHIIPKSEWYQTGLDGRYTHPIRKNIAVVTMGVDFGGSKSSHAFVLTGFTRGFRQMVTLKEVRITEEVDPSELDRRFVHFVQECKAEYPTLSTVYCDSAEQVLIRGFRNAVRRAGIPISVRNARKGEIIDRIRFFCTIQSQMRHFCISDCEETISAFEQALWDPDKEDVRLDDGTTNIDSLDAQEYSAEPYMKIMMDIPPG